MSVPDARVEIAFATLPDDPAPAWTDVTPWVDLSSQVSITCGRGDEVSQVQPSTLSLTLDNSDGRFTAGRAASPYYPNVKIGRQIRVYTGSRAGNLLSAENASFEGGTTGGWAAYGTAGATTASSTTQHQDGANALRVVWTSSLQGVQLAATGLGIGVRYTFSAYVYVGGTTGSSVGIGVSGIGTSAIRTSWNNTWGRLSFTFTATASTHLLQLSTIGATSRTDYVDAVMLEESSTASPFTVAQPPAPRFTGYLDEWPIEWAPGAFWAKATVTATDRLKRLGQIGEFTNVVSEEILYDSPAFYYPLGEDSESLTAGDVSASGQGGILSVWQTNTGGTLEFAAGTGPGTDGISAPLFTPVNAGNGQYLSGRMTAPIGFPAVTLRTVINTTGTYLQTAGRVLDDYGSFLTLDVSASGKLIGQIATAFSGVLATATSSASVNDGRTHTLAVEASVSGGTVAIAIFVDGVPDGSATYSSSSLPLYTRAQIGGTSAGQMFTGTISHFAGFNSALPAARLLAQHQAGVTGFAGESSDARIARYARWAGITATSFEAGASTSIAHVDTNGQAPLTVMQTIADTENGVLFVDGSGVLRFQSRAHRYNGTPKATLAAGDYGEDSAFVSDDSHLVNDVTANREGGIAFRAIDASSVADYGSYRKQVTLVTTSDNEVVDAANWTARRQSQPTPRMPGLSVDLLTNAPIVAAVQTLTVGDLVRLAGLPSQAPATTVDLFIEGWQETVSANEWTVRFNATPATLSNVFVLDDPTYGALDAYPLAY